MSHELARRAKLPKARGVGGGGVKEPSPVTVTKERSVDYLLEMRNKRREPGSTWQQDMRDTKLSTREKYERVSEKVRKLEGEAQRKE